MSVCVTITLSHWNKSASGNNGKRGVRERSGNGGKRHPDVHPPRASSHAILPWWRTAEAIDPAGPVRSRIDGSRQVIDETDGIDQY